MREKLIGLDPNPTILDEDQDPPVLLTTEEFARSYLEDRGRWYGEILFMPWDQKLPLVLAVLEIARLPEHADIIGMIGVGPFEDMMSDWLLDQLAQLTPFDEKMRYALDMMYMFGEPPHLQERFNRLMAIGASPDKKA
ncbi:MAG: hypothetical protein ACRCUX_06965 [Beijerinckiaceae bacterium]